MPYQILISPEALDHIRNFPARQRRIVTNAIALQLTNEPTIETRNRKPMRPNPIAPWELRIGEFRVYYDVREPDAIVDVRAVGIKERNQVRIGGDIIEL